MTPSAEYMNQPFELAIKFFKNKVNLPTENWDDLWKGMHARAFVVAGAMKSELLCDLRSAVDKAISQGTTLDEFRKDFDALVDRHGWSYKGGRKWRSAVIYNTNLSVAYATGHYQAMQEVKDLRPFWRYVPSSSKNPRLDHRQWYNTVLPADDPWWDTHYPPNDWGCKCGVTNHSAREVERLKKKFDGTEFPISETRPQGGTYEWIDKHKNTHYTPEGIGKGWDYNPGKAAWGERLEAEVMEDWANEDDKWEDLTPGDFEKYSRPEKIPLDPTKAKFGPRLETKKEVAAYLKEVLGAEEKAFQCDKVPLPQWIRVNADFIAQHIPTDRSPYLPLLPEVIKDPYEIWYMFRRHKKRGQVVLRAMYIKAFDLPKKKGVELVLSVRNGMFEGYTFIPMSKVQKLNLKRKGMLMWARED